MLEVLAVAAGLGAGLSLGRRSRQAAHDAAREETESAEAKISSLSSTGEHLRGSIPGRTITVMLVGESGVGKTLICRRITDPEALGRETLQRTSAPSWHRADATLRAASPVLPPQRLCVQMLDTPGRESIAMLNVPFFRSVQAVVLVFDVGSAASFQALKDTWYVAVQRHRISAGKASARSCVVLAHVIDERRERQVTRREAAQWCAGMDLAYFETHANDGGLGGPGWRRLLSHLADASSIDDAAAAAMAPAGPGALDGE